MFSKTQLANMPGISPITVSSPAINASGERTFSGHYVKEDFDAIHAAYPILNKKQLKEYIGFFNDARVAELLGPLELLQRWSEESFSCIRDLSTKVVNNPLSILTIADTTVLRIKTTEIEYLHKAMEKLSMRQGTVIKINDLMNRLFGQQIYFACSCCVGLVATKERLALLNSTYYNEREAYGRRKDSDVNAPEGNLFMANSIQSVPNELIKASRDVGQNEVKSYLRYHKNLTSISTPTTIDVTVPATFFNA